MSMSNTSRMILSALLSSSESSSDQEELIAILSSLENPPRRRKKRRILKRKYKPESDRDLEIPKPAMTPSPKTMVKKLSKVKLAGFSEDISDDEFRQNLRLSRTTFELLYEKYMQFSPDRATSDDKTPKRKHLLCFLWFAGSMTTIREVAEVFDLSLSMTHLYLNSVIEFLVDLGETLMRLPADDEEKARLAYDFSQISGLPNVIGCIERMEVKICSRPAKVRSGGYSAIIMQGICDHKKRFIYIDREIKDSTFARICGEHYCLLGGASFKLREWIITKFPKEKLPNPGQEMFNEKFAATQCLIENAFSLLKDRFQQLIQSDFKQIHMAIEFVVACCVLHNFAINCDDEWVEDDKRKTETDFPSTYPPIGPKINFICQKGMMKRDRMMQESCMVFVPQVEKEEVILEVCWDGDT